MNLSAAVDWSGFLSTISGDGTYTVTGAKLACYSGLNTGVSRASKYLKVFPGDRVKATCFARRISGADATSGGLAIDYPSVGTLVNRVRVISADWQEYAVEYSVPLTATSASYVTVSIGVFTADAGEVEFLYPQISVENSTLGAPRVFAAGLITMTAGTPSINTTFTNTGIKALAYNAGTSTLTLTISPGIAGTFGINPIFFAQMTPDAGTGALALVPRVGTFTPATGTLEIKFVNTTTGAIENVATFGTFYFSFIALG